MEPKYWDDLNVGDRYTTISRTVTETDLVNFVGLTGLFESLFIDREYVQKESIFGRPIIPGPLTFCLSLGLENLTGVAKDRGMAFLGLDELRALRPVFINDTIQLEAEVVSKHETQKKDRGIITLKFTTKNQHGEPVLTCRLTRMVRRRPSAGSGPE
ncbi:MAG: MaoC family dehydratase [Dehalococcoidia bacterium]